jgi:hypothetical protein
MLCLSAIMGTGESDIAKSFEEVKMKDMEAWKN